MGRGKERAEGGASVDDVDDVGVGAAAVDAIVAVGEIWFTL